jgi:hypothetical protein
MNYSHTINMLNRAPMDKKPCSLLDYRCGKGRVAICAAAYSYNQIIGLETRRS